MLDEFVAEMTEINREMSIKISKLIETKMESTTDFESLGQMVDRIYGTAATLGFKHIAEYTLALKEIAYMASDSNNETGKKKTIKMFITYMDLSKRICEVIYDEKNLAELTFMIKQEVSRAELLNRKEFYSVKKKSC